MEKADIKNVKSQTKNTKSRKNFDFCTLQFFRQGRIPPGDILQCFIHQIALGELVNTRVCRKA